MCRRNQALGCCALAFGIGLLLGHCLESGFFCLCLGVGLLVLGFCKIRQK